MLRVRDGPGEVIERVPLFAGLVSAMSSEIASMFKERRFAAGETVTKEGVGAAAFFVIESGQATVSIRGNQVRTLGRGDYFGEIALIDEGARSATVTASTDFVCLRAHVLGVPAARPDKRNHRLEPAADARQETADRAGRLGRVTSNGR